MSGKDGPAYERIAFGFNLKRIRRNHAIAATKGLGHLAISSDSRLNLCRFQAISCVFHHGILRSRGASDSSPPVELEVFPERIMQPEMPEVLMQQFDRLRSRIRAVSAVGGLGLMFSLVAGFIGLSLLADVLLDLPLGLRVGMLFGTITFAVLGSLYWVIRPVTKQVQETELAAFVEHQFPQLNERLLSSVELRDDAELSASPMMKSWLLQETVSLSRKVDFSDAVDASRAIRRCWGGGIACLALLLPLLFAADSYAVLFSRFVNPWGNYERVQNLVLTIVDGHRVVAEKSDVTIVAKASWRFKPGELPKSIWLEQRTEDGRTDGRRLDWDTETESFVATLPRVKQSFDYHVSAQRSRTQTYHIDVVTLPAIQALTIEISPPPYTGHAAQSHDLALGEIMSVEQSHWEVTAHFNKPVKTAEILWLDQGTGIPNPREPELLADGTPIRNRTTLTLNKERTAANVYELLPLEAPAGRFAIRATDEYGLHSETDLIRRLTLIPDTAPIVQFADREENPAAKPHDLLTIPVRASDDFGIAALELHYEVIRSEAVREQGVLPAERFEVGTQQTLNQFLFDLTPLQLQPGMRIAMRGRATDERPVPAANEAWTVTRYLMIRNDAKPYGDQSAAEQHQRIEQVLETLKTELMQQKENAKQLEQVAKDANASQKDWNAHRDEQELQEKLEKLQQQMEKLSALFEQQPIFEKIAEETQKIAEGQLQQAAEQIAEAQQASVQQKPEKFHAAADSLNTAANQLSEMQQQYNELAELQRDLLELNRLANQTEKLANSVQNLETRQAKMQSQLQAEQPAPAPQQATEQKQWELDQRKAWEDHQQLSDTLNGLFERRPELAEAAGESLQQHLAELAQRAEQLAEQQDALTRATQENAQQLAQALEPITEAQSHIAVQTKQLAEQLSEPEQKKIAESATKNLQKAQAATKSGDAATAAQEQLQAQRKLQDLTQQLQVEPDNPMPAGEAVAAPKELANQAAEIADLLQESLQKIEETLPGTLQAAQRQLAERLVRATAEAKEAGEKSPHQTTQTDQAVPLAEQVHEADQGINQSQTKTATDQSQIASTAESPAIHSGQHPANSHRELPQKQKELAERAQDIKQKIEDQAQPNESTLQASQEFLNSAQQAAAKSQNLNLKQAAQAALQASASAQKMLDSLRAGKTEELLKKLAEEATAKQAQLAQELQKLADDEPAQKQMQAEFQKSLQKQTQELSRELEQRAQELAANPINKQAASKQGAEAQQLARQASQSMSQSQAQSQSNNQSAASDSSQHASDALKEAAAKARQASGPGSRKPSESGAPSPVPGEVGEQVAQASRQLNSAGQMLQQMGAPVPGTPGDQSSEDGQPQSSEQQAMNGGESEGQQPGNEPQSGGQQMSPSEALRQAAQSMRQAAGQMKMPQSKQQPRDSQQQPQSSSSGSGNQASDFGTDQQLSDLVKLQSDLSNLTKRDWGQLPGELQTELLESSQKKSSGEYSRLVRRYFDEISKSRAPALNEVNNP